MARYARRRAARPRRSSYRRPVARRRRISKRRTARTQRIVIQVVGAGGGVLAAPVTLGSKTLRPLRRRF